MLYSFIFLRCGCGGEFSIDATDHSRDQALGELAAVRRLATITARWF